MPDKLYQECRAVMSGCRAIFEDLLDSGVELVPVVTEKKSDQVSVAEVSLSAQVPAQTAAEDTLEAIQQEISHCQKCGLGAQRKQVAFGSGNPHARLVLVAAAPDADADATPDADEDAQGEPLVGAAGQLLERILFAMKLSRDEVYICNVIKCCPPSNREPGQEEFSACESFLKRQLAVITPEVILCLGPFATQALLQTTEPLAKLRGRWQTYAGIPLMPTFHPAFLLQNPTGKHQTWEDVKQVMHRLQDGA